MNDIYQIEGGVVIIPKKIEDPLEGGLVSKIYLVAFNDYRTMYDLAKNVLDVRPHQVNRWVNNRYPELFEKKVEREKKKPIRSKVKAFLTRIEEEWKQEGIELTQSERQQLREFLEGPFRKATQEKYLEIDYSDSVNAYQHLLGVLFSIAGMEIAARDFERFLKTIGGDFRFEDLYAEASGLKSNPYFEVEEIKKELSDFPRELLEKIMKIEPEGAMKIAKQYGQIGQNTLNQLEELLGNFGNHSSSETNF